MLEAEIIATPKNSNQRLVLFELSCGGHYPEYLSHLIKYWYEQKLSEDFILVVSPQFLQRHPEVVDLTANQTDNSVKFITITDTEVAKLTQANTTYKRIKRAFQEFNLAQKYAKILQADHILFTYFDTRQIPLAFGKKLPAAVSGIYFRPRFHYEEFDCVPVSWQEKLIIWQEKLLLRVNLNNSQLKNLFCLDPYVVKYLESYPTKVKVLPLADPVSIDSHLTSDTEQLKTSLGIEPERKVFLLFGGLTKRKGVFPLLKALTLLSIPENQKLCLLLVGSITSEFKQKIQPQIDQLVQSKGIQIISDYNYVSDDKVQQYFQLADVILALYQRHVGMSGILMRAAAAGKPVLSSNYGLMGEITRRYQLGIDVDASNPEAIALQLRQLISKPAIEFANEDLMKLFTTQNSATNFASTIFHNLKFFTT